MFERLIKGMIKLRNLNDCESFHQKNERASNQCYKDFIEAVKRYDNDRYTNNKKYKSN